MAKNIDQMAAPDNEEIDLSGDTSKTPNQRDYRQAGEKIFAGLLLLLGAILAAPVLLIHFIKSPPIDQHLNILWISYHPLVFIFLLSAAAIAVSSFVFYLFNTRIMLVMFAISLFASLPLIVGLTRDLTFQQVILDIPSQTWLPFLLKPAYILIHLVLPAGILVFLLLQIRTIFSKKRHSYVFLGAAAYLLAAAFIGFSGLQQTGVPNMVSLVSQYQAHVSMPAEQSSPETAVPPAAESPMKPPAAASGQPGATADQPGVPSMARPAPPEMAEPAAAGLLNREVPDQQATNNVAPAPALTTSPVPEQPFLETPASRRAESEVNQPLTGPEAMPTQKITGREQLPDQEVKQPQEELDQLRDKVAILSDKVDRLILAIGKGEFVSVKPLVPAGNRTEAESEKISAVNAPAVKPSLRELDQKIEQLSSKIDRISEILQQMNRPDVLKPQ